MANLDIFNIEEGNYGAEYKTHLIEQYKAYIQDLNGLNVRRQKTNDFFLTLNTALIAFLGVMIQFSGDNFLTFLFLASVSGAVICFLWYRLIKSYGLVSASRYRIIHKIESKLPSSQYSEEWKLLCPGEGKCNYTPITHLESKIPWVFIVFYILLIVSLSV